MFNSIILLKLIYQTKSINLLFYNRTKLMQKELRSKYKRRTNQVVFLFYLNYFPKLSNYLAAKAAMMNAD